MDDYAASATLGLEAVSSQDPRDDSASGNTSLDDDESEGLIPEHVETRGELNEWEALNIASAHEWLSHRRIPDVLNVPFLRELHRQMYGRTWNWAGDFRRSDKTISPHHWSEVSPLMHDLVENTRTQYEASTRTAKELDEIAMRFHHNLVRIHPWPNGNGRHARLATDLLLEQWHRPAFTWGGGDLTAVGAARKTYIRALQRADAGEFDSLRQFVRT